MTLHQILYFDTIAREQHMGRASRHLLVSQPSLSVSMVRLEEELGVPLFDRKGHRLTLTKEGEIFLSHTERILCEVALAEKHMEELSKGYEMQIRIGCIAPVLQQYLPEKIRHFQEKSRYQEVCFEIETGHTKELIEKLKKEELDLVLCSSCEDPELTQICVREEKLVLIAPKEDVFLEKIKDIKELEGVPLIGYDHRSAMDLRLEALWREYGISISYICRLPDDRSIASFVAQGIGYAIVPEIPGLETFSVQRKALFGDTQSRKICLTTREGIRTFGAVKAWIEELIK